MSTSEQESKQDVVPTQDDDKSHDHIMKEKTPIPHLRIESKDSPNSNNDTFFKEPPFMKVSETKCMFLKDPLNNDKIFELDFEGGAQALLETDDEKMLTQKDNSPTKVWKFGRSKKKVDILLPQLSRISNIHFKITLERNFQFYLTDLSRNGTWLNGTKIPRNMKIRLFDFDVIGVGYGIKEDCTDYEIEINNTFLAQYRFLFLKKLHIASKDNANIRAIKEHSDVVKSIPKKRNVDDLRNSPFEKESHSKEPVLKKNKAVSRNSNQVPFLSNKMPLGNNDKKDLQVNVNGALEEEEKIVSTTIQQKYHIFDELLGQGAFAVVKKAERIADKKQFAIKIITKAKLIGTNIDAVRGEMEVLRSINHSRIVKLHDFFEDKDNCYIVMDLVTGGDLMDFVAENGAIEEDACCEIAFQIVEAVKYMHENNITHRDLKPDNILIEQDSPVLIKITDFGLAKKGTVFKTFCGTLAYIAPELIQDIDNRGQLRPRFMRPEYTAQVDMWSLGCLIYVIMTGHLPFSSASEEGLFAQIKTGDFHRGPLELNKISERGIEFLKGLICVDPEKRLKASEALKQPWFLENRGSLMEPSQNNAISQCIALSQNPNNQKHNVNNKSDVQKWKKDPVMDGSSQPWKRQKDQVTPKQIPKGFIPLTDNEIPVKNETTKTDKLVFYHRAKSGNDSKETPNLTNGSDQVGKRNLSNSYNLIDSNGFDKEMILRELSVQKSSSYYEQKRESLIKLYPLKNIKNTTATKKLLGIDKKVFTIGRNRLADYTILDNTISKFHCMLVQLPEEDDIFKFSWWLYCYSTNPMFVNDMKLTKYMKIKVYVGDAIKFVWNITKNTYSGFYIPYMATDVYGSMLKNEGLLEDWTSWRSILDVDPTYRGTAKNTHTYEAVPCTGTRCAQYPYPGPLFNFKHVDVDKGNPVNVFPDRDPPVVMTEEEKSLHNDFLNKLAD